jgi:hypothetical protein
MMFSPGSKDPGFESQCSPVCWWKSMVEWLGCSAQDQRTLGLCPGVALCVGGDPWVKWLGCSVQDQRTLGLVHGVALCFGGNPWLSG